MSKRLSVLLLCALLLVSVGSALTAARPDSATVKSQPTAVKSQPTTANSRSTALAVSTSAKPQRRSAASDTDSLHPPTANSLSDSARLDTYIKPDGSGYFALSLSPSVSLPTAAANETVVLFDTSASQVGVFRDRALTALRAFASECHANDRVQLIAVDLSAIPLTDSFVAVDSPQWKEAVAKLEHRVPLGATDIPLALRAAWACFSPQTTAAKTAIYIGDGISAADVIVPDEFVRLCGEFVEAHLPITSFAVGPRCDGQLLAALANHTGGMLVIDGERIEPKEAGAFPGAHRPRASPLADVDDVAQSIHRHLSAADAAFAQRPRYGFDRHGQDFGHGRDRIDRLGERRSRSAKLGGKSESVEQ